MALHPKSAPELTKWFEKKGIAKVRSRKGYDDGSSSHGEEVEALKKQPLVYRL